jgi:hypothetical protein
VLLDYPCFIYEQPNVLVAINLAVIPWQSLNQSENGCIAILPLPQMQWVMP